MLDRRVEEGKGSYWGVGPLARGWLQSHGYGVLVKDEGPRKSENEAMELQVVQDPENDAQHTQVYERDIRWSTAKTNASRFLMRHPFQY